MKLTQLLLLIALFYFAISTPQSCNSGADGNGLSAETSEADLEFFRFRRPTAKASYGRPTFRQRAQNKIEQIRGQVREHRQRGGRILKKVAHKVKDVVKKGVEKVKKAFTKEDFDKYANGDAEKDKQAQKQAEKLGGAQSTKGGKFVFVELTAEKLDKCLGEYFFCTLDCKELIPNCRVTDAKMYSVFVPRRQHADICVKDRYLHPIRTYKESKEYKESCLLRPCSCDRYTSWFQREYGAEYNEGIKTITEKCANWCTSGVKPKVFVDTNTRKAATERNKNALLEGFSRLHKWLANMVAEVGAAFVKFGGHVKQGFLRLGGHLKNAGKVIGNHFRNVGGHLKNAGKAVGNHFRNAGRKISAGFRRVGGAFRRFFRRRW